MSNHGYKSNRFRQMSLTSGIDGRAPVSTVVTDLAYLVTPS